jgi:glycosyltransferase involved in cell wall biosynthesis
MPSIQGGEGLDVSVVLPVYNERDHLRQEIDRISEALDRSDLSYEVIVVDDGSDDGSGDDLRRIDGIRLIQFAQNRGSGSARKYGTRAARGRIVVWTDVDMTYPNDLIPELVAQMAGADQVVGARTSEKGTHKHLRGSAKWFIRRLASYLVQTPIPDLNSGLRAFRRDVALQYVSQLPAGFSCVTTITLSFLANGYSIRYWPIEYRERAGASKFHWFKDTRRYLLQVIRMVLSYNPLRIFLPVGLGLAALGTGKLVYDLTAHHFKVAADTLLILFAAFQVLAIGMLADLIGRTSRARNEVQPTAVEPTAERVPRTTSQPL